MNRKQEKNPLIHKWKTLKGTDPDTFCIAKTLTDGTHNWKNVTCSDCLHNKPAIAHNPFQKP